MPCITTHYAISPVIHITQDILQNKGHGRHSNRIHQRLLIRSEIIVIIRLDIFFITYQEQLDLIEDSFYEDRKKQMEIIKDEAQQRWDHRAKVHAARLPAKISFM